jgi:hypothetical protein
LAAIAAKIKYYKERTVEEYTLLVENDPFKLESQINNCLNQGWVLHGSVVVAFTDKQQWFHYQAMVRSKSAELAATVPPVGAANSQSVTALSEIVWDWLTENAVDVMVDECDVNILIQRLNAGVPALHT